MFKISIMATSKYQKHSFGNKCVCIGRVSTGSQSQTAQIRDLEEYAKSRGYNETKIFFTTESGFLEYDQKQGWNLVTDFFECNSDYKVSTIRQLLCEMDLMIRYVQKHPSAARKQWQKPRSGCN